jgi:hypothetical protein
MSAQEQKKRGGREKHTCTGNHVLDEISVTGSIDDGDLRVRDGQDKDRGHTLYLGVSNFQRAMSMVIPRSRSALSLSRTHAYLKAIGQR